MPIILSYYAHAKAIEYIYIFTQSKLLNQGNKQHTFCSWALIKALYIAEGGFNPADFITSKHSIVSSNLPETSPSHPSTSAAPQNN